MMRISWECGKCTAKGEVTYSKEGNYALAYKNAIQLLFIHIELLHPEFASPVTIARIAEQLRDQPSDVAPT